MIHIGAALGAALSQGHSTTLGFSTKIFRRFRNPKDKRDFVTAGVAVGVATAFNAPIGGLLFAFEEVASFWQHSLGWQVGSEGSGFGVEGSAARLKPSKQEGWAGGRLGQGLLMWVRPQMTWRGTVTAQEIDGGLVLQSGLAALCIAAMLVEACSAVKVANLSLLTTCCCWFAADILCLHVRYADTEPKPQRWQGAVS
jgi:hypothetical protein